MIRIYAFIGGAVALLLSYAVTYQIGKRAGENAFRAEQARVVERKLKDASIADDAHNRCLADPACRVSDDGFRRD